MPDAKPPPSPDAPSSGSRRAAFGLGWRRLVDHAGGPGRFLTIGVASMARGLSEATVLVLIAGVATSVADTSTVSTSEFDLPGPLAVGSLTTGQALGLAAALSVVSLILIYVNARAISHLVTTTMLSDRTRLIRAFHRADWDLQSREREGQLQDALTSQVGRVVAAVGSVASGLAALLTLVMLLLVAVGTQPVTAFVLIVGLAGLVIVLRPLTLRTRDLAATNRDHAVAFATSVAEIVSKSQEIAVFGVGPAAGRRLQRRAAVDAATARRVQILVRLVPGLYQGLALLALIAGLAVVVATDTEALAGAAATALLLLRSITYAQELQGVAATVNEVQPYLDAVDDRERAYRERAVTDGTVAVSAIDSLRLTGVTYSYGGGAPALEDVDLDVERGGMVGIVGPSGAGKSTLAHVILRLRTPQRGSYSVSGVPAGDIRPEDWHRMVAVVPQKPQLIEGTVAENITFLRPGLTRDAVEAAARAAHIHEEIEAMEDGYDTVLAGIGHMVSGGQAQRLCLARALVARPEMLVLDEPTSSLDAQSDALVSQTLAELEGEVTVIVIAHRMATLRECGTIVVLDDGRVRGVGPPETLRATSAYFREALELSGGSEGSPG